MNILFIELCNYMDYPTGGHLSFALHVLRAFGENLKLVGIDTNNDCEIGKWIKKDIDGKIYDYFCVAHIKKDSKKPIVPSRITAYFQIRKYINKVLKTDFDKILVQTPEVLLALPTRVLKRTCLVMPGVGNPLKISRYKFAHLFARLYDKIFYRKASLVDVILPAADEKSIEEFVSEGKGKIIPSKVRQFPTRYDADVFKIKNKEKLRQKYSIEDSSIIYVTVGRLNWFKGWKFMIDSFSLLKSPNSRLLFIGDGEDELLIRDYIIEKDLVGKVLMLGRQPLDVISDYLNMADAFVMGSYREGWSTALVEAIACALPCVVTDFSSASDMIENGVNGYVVKERDIYEFAKRLDDALLLNKRCLYEKANEISCLSVQNMREHFLLKTSWNK